MQKILNLTMILSVFLFAQTAFASGTKPAPLNVEGATTVTDAQAKELFDQGVLFIDTRVAKYFPKGHIPNAINISTRTDLTEEALLKVMSKDDKAVFYCHGEYCPASSTGLRRAISWGFSNLYYYRTGMKGWEDAQFPIAKGLKPVPVPAAKVFDPGC